MDKGDWLDEMCGYYDCQDDPYRDYLESIYGDNERVMNNIESSFTKSKSDLDSTTYNISNQVNQIVEIRNSSIDVKSGLRNKVFINKWVRLNYSSKFIPKSDTTFILLYILPNFSKTLNFYSILMNNSFRRFYYRSLHYYKLSNIVVKNNYYLYSLNTPDNLLLSFVLNK